MKFYDPRATQLKDHKPNFQGTTYRVEKDGDKSIVLRTDREEDEKVTEASGRDHLEKARARAQVLAKKNSNSSSEAIVRVPEYSETLGFGGKYEEMEDRQAKLGESQEEEDKEEKPERRTVYKLRKKDGSTEEVQTKKMAISRYEAPDSDFIGENPVIAVIRDRKERAEDGFFFVKKRTLLRAKNDRIRDIIRRMSKNTEYEEELEDEQATLGNDEEEDKELVDNRRDKTSKKKDEEEKDKAEFVKKAETLEPYQDDQDNLERFEKEEEESENEWERNYFDEEGEDGEFGPNSEILKTFYHPEKGSIRIEKYETIKSDPEFHISIQNPPEFMSSRKYDSLRGAERRAEKYMNGELNQ